MTRNRSGHRALLFCVLVLCLSFTALVACDALLGVDFDDARPSGPTTPDAKSDGPSVGPDGESPDATTSDASVADARPIDLGNCSSTQCAAGAISCVDEDCAPPDWSTTTADGGVAGATGGRCTTVANGGIAYYFRQLDESASYFYDLRYSVRIEQLMKGAIGEIGPSEATVRIDVDGTKLRACYGLLCTPETTIPVGVGTDFIVRVYGQMGKTRAFGSLVLQIDCAEVGLLDLKGPFTGIGGKVKVRVGCLGGSATCDLIVDDIVSRVLPN